MELRAFGGLGCLLLGPCVWACTVGTPQNVEAPPNELVGAGPAEAARPRVSKFVTAHHQQLFLEGEPYRFVGVNFWYGAYLGADGATGDIERLRAELDALRKLGVTNLRVLGASESGPMKNSIKPTFRGPGDDYNEELLRGLDVLLAEMAQRDMKAVIYLNNFWEWSGGMGTYLSWVNGGEFVDLADPDKPWPAYPLFTMRFYADQAANELFRHYVEAVISRKNSVTSVPYREDSTIMAWQLANEPRPGYQLTPGNHALPDFLRFIDGTARFIKSLDPNHMVSTGNEGVMGCADDAQCFLKAHAFEHIDYLTFHMWPKNWGWLKDDDMPGSMARTLENARAYIDAHVEYARQLDKPIVLEEFGLPRDEGSLVPGSPTTLRDRFFGLVFSSIEASIAAGGPFVGSNAWTWGGRGRAQRTNGEWQASDTNYTGDPPQEPQGLNSVFDVDHSTLAIFEAHARAIARQ